MKKVLLVSMACQSAYSASFSPSSLKGFGVIKNTKLNPFQLQFSSIGNKSRASYNTLVSEAVRLLGPPASFEASKLKVAFMGEGLKYCSAITPRTYILSHCNFTANLNLTIANVINLDQLKGWYNKDDVVAEWKKVKERMFLNVHRYVSGPNLLLDLAAEFRYHIFSKELPLVLKAVLHGDSVLFAKHPELMDALVCVYFHSSLPKYNRMECWGLLKDAAEIRIVTLHQRNGEEVQNPSFKLYLLSFYDLCTWPEAAAFLLHGCSTLAKDK